MLHEQDHDPLKGAVCATLPGFVVDKYFRDYGEMRGFRRNVAKAICGHCIAKAPCLEIAIQNSVPLAGILAGQGSDKIAELRELYINGVPLDELVDETMYRDDEQGYRASYLHPEPPRAAWILLEPAVTAQEASHET